MFSKQTQISVQFSSKKNSYRRYIPWRARLGQFILPLEMFLIRLLIVGETGVGKTSLLLRFHEDQFVVNQKTTIGVDYKAKEVQINNEPIKLQVIWNFFGSPILSHLLLLSLLDMGYCWSGAISVDDFSLLQQGTRSCCSV